MITDLIAVAGLLVLGNVLFWHFDPSQPLWRRALKIVVTLAITGLISQYFGRLGVVVAVGLVLIPVIYIHAIWLPRHGVNGWTAEPKEKYYALRKWVLPPKN